MDAAGARTRRSLGHHLLHPQILRLLVLKVSKSRNFFQKNEPTNSFFYPEELWVSKQRVHIVLEASKSAGAKGDVPKICGFVHPLHPL